VKHSPVPRKITLFSFALGIVLLGLINWHGRSASPSPLPYAGPMQISGWVYPDCPDAMETITRNKPASVRIEWQKINQDGAVELISQGDDSCKGFSPDNLAKIKDSTPNVWMTVSGRIDTAEDGGYKLLHDSVKRQAAVNAIADFVTDNDLTGTEIDFEPLSFTSPETRDAYTSFTNDLAAKLHSRGKQLALDLPAQDPDALHYFNWKYSDLLAADQLVVMAYDRHFDEPGPITPDKWLETVIDYAKSQVPVEKLVIGLPNYGYLAQGKSITNLGTTQRLEWLKKNPLQGKPERDPDSQELHVKAAGFTVWYPDEQTVNHKLKLAQKMGVSQVSFWYIGDNNPWP
jgi:spore germination protein